MDPNNPQNIHRQIHKQESDPTVRILGVVALQLSDLKGKTVVDVGSGQRGLAKKVKKEHMNTHVISYDISREMLGLSGHEEDKDIVVANFFEDLFSSFHDGSVDYIINVGGPFRGGPFSSKALEFYGDGIRVLKPGGEIRILNPYQGELGGIAALLYHQFREAIDVSQIDFKAFFGDEYEKVEFDECGVPNPIPPGDDFWIDYFNRIPKKNQEEYYRYISKELNERLDPDENKIVLSLIEREIGSPDEYSACLIIRRL